MEGLRELSTEVTMSAEFLDRPEAPELCEVTRVTWGLVTTGLKETVWGALYVTRVTWGLLTTRLTDPPDLPASAAATAPCNM